MFKNIYAKFFGPKEITFTVETFKPDESGFVIKKAGLITPDKVPICVNFDATTVFADGKLHFEGDKLMCTARIQKIYYDLVPSLQLHITEVDPKNKKICTKCTVMAIGLHINPNIDPDVKSIKQQLKNV